MQTEPLILPVAPRPEDAVSRVFRSGLAQRCFIATERYEEAPLTPAGYQLTCFRTYRLMFLEPVAQLVLLRYPNHVIRVQDPNGAVTKHEQQFRVVSFRVTLDGWWKKLTYLGVDPYQLEVEAVLPDGNQSSFSLPIIVRQGLSMKVLLVLVLSAFLSVAWHIIYPGIWDWQWQEVFSLKPWLWCLGLAALAPAKNLGSQLFTKYYRARDLENAFHQRWRTVR